MEHYTIELPRGIWNFFKRRRLNKRLNKKLHEYMDRYNRAKNVRAQDDAWHKMQVLSAVLEYGHIETRVWAETLQYWPQFDWFLFERACAVISAYVYNTPGILTGGIGLPK